MIASTSPTYAPLNVYTIDYGQTVTSSVWQDTGVIINYGPEYSDSLVEEFVREITAWRHWRAERDRQRKLETQRAGYARRLEALKPAPPRLPRRRVCSGASRYRVMFY